MEKSVFETLFPNIDQTIILYALLAIAIFLLLREFHCWYWKINHSVKLQKNIYNRLDSIEELLKDLSAKNKSEKIDK